MGVKLTLLGLLAVGFLACGGNAASGESCGAPDKPGERMVSFAVNGACPADWECCAEQGGITREYASDSPLLANCPGHVDWECWGSGK